MTINRTTLLDLPLPVTGTESGTWGDVTNNGLSQYVDIAVAGMNALTSSAFTEGALTLSNSQGDSSGTNIAAGSAQYATIKVSSLVQHSTITAPASNRSYRIVNADEDYNLTIKASDQTGITFLPGQTGVVAFTGTDYEVVGVVNAASSTDNAVPRFNGTTGQIIQNSGVTIDGSNVMGGITQLNVDNLRLDGNAITSTNTDGNIDLTPNGTGEVNISKVDIDSGTIDGAVIGGASAAAGSFTTLGASSTATFAAGAVGTPAITTTGDTNTGIFFPAADTIAFAEGGAEAMRIDSSGQVIVGPFGGNGNAVVAGSSSPGYTNQPGTNLLLKSGDGSGTGFSFMTFSTSPAGSSGTTVNTAAERMRIDSSGNVGIGTTSPSYPLHVIKNQAATTSISVDNNTGNAASHASLILHTGGASSGDPFVYFYNEITDWSIGCDNSDSDKFKISKSSTLGTNDYFNIDSSGNVGIGTNAPINELTFGPTTSIISPDTTDGSDSKRLRFCGGGAAAGSRGSYVTVYGNEYSGAEGELTLVAGDAVGGNIVFYTGSAVERGRITSGGFFKASVDGTYLNAAGYHELKSNAGAITVSVTNTNASTPNGIFIYWSGATPNNTSQYFLYCQDSTNEKAIIWANGNFESRTNSYGGISDVKLKQDIVDANSQWDDIKGLRVVKYRFKDEVAADPNYPSHLGVIAQEVELVSPGLIDEHPDYEEIEVPVLDDEGNPVLNEDGTPQVTKERNALGTTTKSVKYSILYMKAVKALQEAIDRIETLEAKVAALEAK
jgi:hypothetical protein